MIEPETCEHLRLAPADLLTHYFEKRAESLAFYRRVRRRGLAPPAFTREFVLYHSWLPGFLELDKGTADVVRVRIHRESGGPLPPELSRELSSRGWIAPALPSVEQLTEKAFTVFPAIQNPKELRRFLEEVARLRPRTVVEIGTAGGGLLYCLAQLAHPEALVASVEPPDGGLAGDGPDERECDLFRTFVGPRQHLVLIRDRSFHYSTRQDLAAALNGRTVDLLLIDGDHSYGAARSDFEMYREFVSPQGLIAFHDILMFPETWGRGFDVGVFWGELRAQYSTREIVDAEAPTRPPPLEQAARWGTPALGFGLLSLNGAN